MKVRLRDNSIRLRVTQGEVRALDQGQAVCSTTALGPTHALTFRLAADSTDQIAVEQTSKAIQIGVPTAELAHWCRGSDVSLRGEQSVGDSQMLQILIEKDFACLVTREGDDDADCFEHPKSKTA